MGERAIENRIKKLRALEEQKKQLDQEIEAVRTEIQKEMEAKGTEEMKAGIYIVRWTSVLSSRFDTKSFKESFGDLYNQFTKQVNSRRFTVSS